MRLFWSYQAAIAGVRDATRYLARIAPADICTSGGSVSGYAGQLETIVETTISGAALFPAGVTVTSLTPTLTCVTSLGLRQASVPVVTVSANLSIAMPVQPDPAGHRRHPCGDDQYHRPRSGTGVRAMKGRANPLAARRVYRTFLADEIGANLVEFSLVVTLFLFLLLAIIDFGRIGHTWVSANKATQLAARLAAVRPPGLRRCSPRNVRGSDGSHQLWRALPGRGWCVCDACDDQLRGKRDEYHCCRKSLPPFVRWCLPERRSARCNTATPSIPIWDFSAGLMCRWSRWSSRA